ncbi:MAG: phosphoglucosamine mutase [Methanophagales archaeon]|nr:phosphoglucosamine mutase [Methanophagales archaeon]MCW3140950.1 phosphoglucosamine mutase [Methanophagales archaeon]
MRLFGTSGIRGKVFKRITPEFCFNLGKAIASSLPEKSNIAIATDTRVTKDLLKSALISGILTCNINVVDLGIVPTPVLAFLTKDQNYDTGVLITASHNPPEYNGIKLWCDGMAYTVHDEQIIEEALMWNEYRMPTWNKIGTLRYDYNAKKAHADELLKRVEINRYFKVVVDPGNGAAADYASMVFKKAGIDVLPLNDEPDGLFPNRSPEPTAETLKETISYLRKENADLAICFDGDADRVVFCDKKGFIGYNEAISFISRLRVQETNKKKVVTTVETGRLFDYAIEDLGGEVIRGKVGDGYVGHRVKEEGASIGVEQVGVYIMPEMGYYPDSIYAAMYLLANIENVEEIRAFINEMPTLYFDKKGVPVADKLKYEVLGRVHMHLDVFPAHRTNSLDGLRLDFEDSWVLIRASGTQPLIRVIAESEDRDELKEIMDMAIQAVNEAKRELT